jgi:Ca2+-binding EF-hand superfamily protein
MNFLKLDYRLFPSKVELQALMKFYDVDGDGNITYEEFVRGLR